MIARSQQTPPVVFVPSGTRITVFPDQDLWLRSAEDDAEYMKENPPEEEDETEYQAKLPQVGSWTQNRKTEKEERGTPSMPAVPTEEIQKETETPLYDGTDYMPDITDRKVEPVVPQEEPLF